MKRFCVLLFVIVLIISCTGCSLFSKTEPTKPAEVVNTEPVSEEPTLEFGKNTYEQSIQVNQKDLPWAVYRSLPSDIILERMELIDDTDYCITTPPWEKYQFENTYLFNNQPDYIMYTFGSDEQNYEEITIRNSVSWKDLVDWQVTNSETLQLGEHNVVLSTGKCHVNNRAQNEKMFVSAIINDENLHGCIIGITEDGAFHTIENLTNTVKEMCSTISLCYEMTEEEPTE